MSDPIQEQLDAMLAEVKEGFDQLKANKEFLEFFPVQCLKALNNALFLALILVLDWLLSKITSDVAGWIGLVLLLPYLYFARDLVRCLHDVLHWLPRFLNLKRVHRLSMRGLLAVTQLKARPQGEELIRKATEQFAKENPEAAEELRRKGLI